MNKICIIKNNKGIINKYIYKNNKNNNNNNNNKNFFYGSPAILLASKILKTYFYNINKDTQIIFGCYIFERDIYNNLKKNNIIIFGGSDTYYKIRSTSKIMLDKLREMTISNRFNIKLYSISNFINSDLDEYKLKYRHIYLCMTNINHFKNINKIKNNIYIYDGNGKMNNSDIYNINMINKILQMIKYNYFKSSINKVEYNKMNDLLNKCFIGLRLTKHDGNSNIVQEMGLVGIKCIHNSWFYNAIPFYDITDIIRNINIEYDKYKNGYIDNVTPYVCKLNSITCKPTDILDKINYDNDEVTVIFYTYNDTERNFCDSLKTILFQHMIKTKVIISTIINDTSITYYNKYFKNNYNNITLIINNIDKTTNNIKNILIKNVLKLINTKWFFILSTDEICYAFKCYKEIQELKKNNKLICLSNYDIINYKDNSENIENHIIKEINEKTLSLMSMMNIDILKYFIIDENIELNNNIQNIFKNILNNNIEIYHYINPTYLILK